MTRASTQVAVKRLSEVEVEPSASHQREFHAGRLRRALGFPLEGARGQLTTAIYGAEDQPIIEDSAFTLYQARQPPRSEFHLYPKTDVFQRHARAGDLLILYRVPGTDGLHAVVARQGSAAEETLLHELFTRGVPQLGDFAFVESPESRPEAALGIANTLDPPRRATAPELIRDHGVFRHAVDVGSYPTTTAMASASADIVRIGVPPPDVDELLSALLDTESALFYAIEEVIAGAELRELIGGSPDLRSILEFSKRRLQSRAARRGASLQHHFAHVLREEQIPFTEQCTPESPPPADFMIPGCGEYHDTSYSADRLRMVSCKTTTRERWYETIPESRRIALKYLLTLDEGLSAQKVSAMWDAGVRPFLPRQTIERAYAGRAHAVRLSSVQDLIGELRAALA